VRKAVVLGISGEQPEPPPAIARLRIPASFPSIRRAFFAREQSPRGHGNSGGEGTLWDVKGDYAPLHATRSAVRLGCGVLLCRENRGEERQRHEYGTCPATRFTRCRQKGTASERRSAEGVRCKRDGGAKGARGRASVIVPERGARIRTRFGDPLRGGLLTGFGAHAPGSLVDRLTPYRRAGARLPTPSSSV